MPAFRYPRTASSHPERDGRLAALPPVRRQADWAAHSAGASIDARDERAPHRRYPSTARTATPRSETHVTSAVVYRWDSRDASLTAVGSRAEHRIEAGFKLANKGALYAARSEFRQAIQAIAEALDARHGVTSHSQAIHEAFRALKEASDFAASGGGVDRVAQIIGTHQTPALKHAAAHGVPALVAMQQYYAFAQHRMVAACGGAPVASTAMYAMGKLHMALADGESQGEQNAAQAMAFLQASLLVDSNNFAAANELGVMLARFGQLPEAREVLRHSASVHPTLETWKNLEVVHQRLGEDQLARRARTEWQRQSQREPATPSHPGGVHWVAPEAFAGRPGGAKPVATAPPLTAEKTTGFSLWPWH